MKKVFAILGALLLTTSLTNAADDDNDAVPAPAESGAPAAKLAPAFDLFGDGDAMPSSSGVAAPSSGKLSDVMERLKAHDAAAGKELEALEARKQQLLEIQTKTGTLKGTLSATSTSQEKVEGFLGLLGGLHGRINAPAADTYTWLREQTVGDHAPFKELTKNVPAGLVRVGNLAILPGDDLSGLAGVVDLKVINEGGSTTWTLSGGAGKGAFTHKAEVEQGSRVISFVPTGKMSGDETMILVSAGKANGGIENLVQPGTQSLQISLASLKTGELIDVSAGAGDKKTVSVSVAPAAALWTMAALEGKEGSEDTVARLKAFVAKQVETDIGQLQKAYDGLKLSITTTLEEIDAMGALLASAKVDAGDDADSDIEG